MHVPRSHEAEDSIHLSVPCAQRRCAASLGALSAQYSNLAAANSKLLAQCGASVNATATSGGALRDGIGSQCTLTCTSLARTCECGGCASVSPSVGRSCGHTPQYPMLGTMCLDPTPGWDPMRGGILRVTGTLDAHLLAGSSHF
jgi:hypothetical protein